MRRRYRDPVERAGQAARGERGPWSTRKADEDQDEGEARLGSLSLRHLALHAMASGQPHLLTLSHPLELTRNPPPADAVQSLASRLGAVDTNDQAAPEPQASTSAQPEPQQAPEQGEPAPRDEPPADDAPPGASPSSSLRCTAHSMTPASTQHPHCSRTCPTRSRCVRSPCQLSRSSQADPRPARCRSRSPTSKPTPTRPSSRPSRSRTSTCIPTSSRASTRWASTSLPRSRRRPSRSSCRTRASSRSALASARPFPRPLELTLGTHLQGTQHDRSVAVGHGQDGGVRPHDAVPGRL